MRNSRGETVQDMDVFDSVNFFFLFGFLKNKKALKIIFFLFDLDRAIKPSTSRSPSASGNKKFRSATIVFSGTGPPVLAFLIPNGNLLEESNP